MTNIWLFLATVLVYVIIVSFWKWMAEDPPDSFFETLKTSWKVKKLALLLLLCTPFNFNGNVFTVFGNAVSDKSVYSVLSFYQKAGGDAESLLSLGGYHEGKDVVVIFGVPSYQKATGTAILGFGTSPYQKGNNVVVFAGLSVFQIADKSADVLLGLSIYQKAHKTVTIFGLSGYQKAGTGAFSQFALYQELEGGKNKSFGIWGFGESVFVKKFEEESKELSTK